MRKTVFTHSMKILIVSLLLLAVFFKRERSQKLMVLALILWTTVIAGILLFRQSGKLAKKCRAALSALKQTDGSRFRKTGTDSDGTGSCSRTGPTGLPKRACVSCF